MKRSIETELIPACIFFIRLFLGSNDTLEILELLVKDKTFKPHHLNLILHEKLTKMDFDTLLKKTKIEQMSLQIYIKIMFRRCKVSYFSFLYSSPSATRPGRLANLWINQKRGRFLSKLYLIISITRKIL